MDLRFATSFGGNYEVAILNTAQKVQEIMTDGYCSAGCSIRESDSQGQWPVHTKISCPLYPCFPLLLQEEEKSIVSLLPSRSNKEGNSCYYDLNQSPTTKDSRKFVFPDISFETIGESTEGGENGPDYQQSVWHNHPLVAQHQYIASYSTVSPKQQWQ